LRESYEQRELEGKFHLERAIHIENLHIKRYHFREGSISKGFTKAKWRVRKQFQRLQEVR